MASSELLTTKTTAKTKKTREFLVLRDALNMVLFLVFLGFYHGFGWFFTVFVVFLNFLQWLRAPDHQNQCKNPEKPRILDFDGYFENVVSLSFLVFTLVLVVVHGFFVFFSVVTMVSSS